MTRDGVSWLGVAAVMVTSFLVFPTHAKLTVVGKGTTVRSASSVKSDAVLCGGGMSRFGTSCYLVVKKAEAFNVARKKCQSLNGRLPVISSEDNNSFLQNLLASKGVPSASIGLDDQNQEGRFVWHNERALNKNSFSKFPKNKKSSAMKDCVALRNKDGAWIETDCNRLHPYVCEFGDFTPGKIRSCDDRLWCRGM